MAALWEVLQEIVSVTRHVGELQSDLKEVRRELHEVRDETRSAITAVEKDIIRLTEAQGSIREIVRSEVALALSELRARFAEEEARRQRPPLDEG